MSARELEPLLWPPERLHEALGLIVRRHRMSSCDARLDEAPAGLDEQALGRFIEMSADVLGVEARHQPIAYPTAEAELAAAAPALVLVPHPEGLRVLLLLSARGGRVRLVGPDARARTVAAAAVRRVACALIEAKRVHVTSRLLDKASIQGRHRGSAHDAIMRELLANKRFEGCWSVRPRPGDDFIRLLRQHGVLRRLLVLLLAHGVHTVLWLASWWIVGRGALDGHLDEGWVVAWMLALATLVPLRVWSSWEQGMLAFEASILLKQRLLVGALKLEPDEIRTQGIGALFGRVIESEGIEALGLRGGFLVLHALVEVLWALPLVFLGLDGWWHGVALTAWLMVIVGLVRAYLVQSLRWTDLRLALTGDLVEGIVGHRTRLAQQPTERWHDEEDELLARYHAQAEHRDRALSRLQVLAPRGWLLLGLVGLVPSLASGTATATALAVALGGTLFVQRAIGRLGMGLEAVAGAMIAWRVVRPVFEAARRSAPVGAPRLAAIAAAPARDPRAVVLDVSRVSFGYHGRAVLEDVALRLCARDRVLVTGPSGGGKSTLVSLLTGLRKPEHGLLLLRGLDRTTLGAEGWRRRLVAAPQFHDNHLVNGTLAFNLLFGRRWPPLARDRAEAAAVCRELGLGELLQRMPAGLDERVGETGWKVSHGERSRLFIARALLHEADVVILDESLAALDPQTLHRCIDCILRRAPALVVIAHP